MTALSIGKLAKAADVKVPTIRFYEQIGLLPQPDRSHSDRRMYDDDAVRRLSFIKRARNLGFSTEAIRTLLDLSDNPDRTCESANALAAEHLAEVERKIRQLSSLRGELRRMASASCAGGSIGECRVIEALSA